VFRGEPVEEQQVARASGARPAARASRAGRSAAAEVRIRPRRALISVAVITFLAANLPLLALLVWDVWTTGAPPWILLVDAGLAALGVALVGRQLTVFAAVRDGALMGNGIFSRVARVPVAAIRRVVFVAVYTGHGTDVSGQVLAMGDGRAVLFRLRAFYWHDADLDLLAEAVGAPVERACTPLSQQEFFETYPGSRYWFERNVPLKVAAVVLAGAIVAAALVGFMSLG